MTTFKDLGLSSWLIKILASVNITKPSIIQQQVIPSILKVDDNGNRRHIFGCSKTGSGKTLTYLLPIVELLVRDPKPYFSLILVPTRELAYQINETIKMLTGANKTGSVLMVKSLLIIGGQNYDDNNQGQGLWFGKPNIVVATPGRLLDQLTNRDFSDISGKIKSINFDMLVLDEADQLISSSFSEQMSAIFQWIDSNDVKTKRRQTLVFSATLTTALEQLQEIVSSKDDDSKPVIFNLLETDETIKRQLAVNSDLDQKYILCPEYVKIAFFVECLLDLEFKQMIVFCATKKEAKLLHTVLLTLGIDGNDFNFNPVLLNSDMIQNLRFAALEKFKSISSRILITTDLANRGLDLPQVDLVVNYSCPKSVVSYIHRVGRTCRKPEFQDERRPNNESSSASQEVQKKNKRIRKATGKALTFITQYDINLVQSIETSIGIKLEKETEIDENGVDTILKKVAVAVKEAEIRIDHEDMKQNEHKHYKQKPESKRKGKKRQKTAI